jgi:hypothetical protein
MSLFGLTRLSIKKERTEAELEEEKLQNEKNALPGQSNAPTKSK